MIEIRYVTGDATAPIGDGDKIIAHIVNDEGKWGRGFVVALSRRWSKPEEMYRMWAAMPNPLPDWAAGGLGAFELGNVQPVDVEPGIVVTNMLAQHGIRRRAADPVAVDYAALDLCLAEVTQMALTLEMSVHMPRIGCGLGGGDWTTVEQIINDTVTALGVPVFVYDLPE